MDFLKLKAVLGVDSKDYDKGIGDAKDKASSLLSAFGKGASVIGQGMATAAKMTGVAVGAAATGIAAVVKESVSAYSEYEQLKGGIETMFEDLSWDVMENAKKAFSTTGMSVNEYLDTVMGFSASLNQSLMKNEGNIARAAEASDQIVNDMADNVSKMGTTMESVQNAYAGFAKGNFTMLDNLKLGYGGTAAEMQRLLDDAEKLTGKKFNLDNFADITEAIHVIQDEMGIAGNAAYEAGETVQGSVGAIGAAWKNLVLGFADPEADLGQLIENVVQSASAAVSKLVPVITRALGGVGQAIEQIAPIIGAELPKLVDELLPPLLSAATTLVQSIAESLPNILSVLSEQLPSIVEQLLPAVMNAFQLLSESVLQMLPSILQIISDNIDVIAGGIASIMEVVGSIVMQSLPILATAIEKGLPKMLTYVQNNISKITSSMTSILKAVGNLIIKLTPTILPMMLQIGVELLTSITKGITENASEMVQGVIQIIQVLIQTLTNPDTLMTIIQCGFEILMAITNGIAENLPLLFDCLGELLANLILFLGDAIPTLVSDIGQFGAKVVTDILPQILTAIGTAVARMILEVSDGISDKMIDLKNKASEFFGKIPEALMEGLAYLAVKIGEFAGDAIDFFKNGFNKMKEVGEELVQGLWNGIKSVKDWIINKIGGFTDDVLSGIKSFFGISSPSKKTAVFGRYLAEGLAVGVEDEAPDAFRDIQNELDRGMNGLHMDRLALDTTANVAVQSKADNPVVTALGGLSDKVDELVKMGFEPLVQVFIAGTQIDEYTVKAKQRLDVRSGGQVNV